MGGYLSEKVVKIVSEDQIIPHTNILKKESVVYRSVTKDRKFLKKPLTTTTSIRSISLETYMDGSNAKKVGKDLLASLKKYIHNN